MAKRFWKGLRTIDLMVALGLICMLLGIILGRIDNFKCRSMQSEAKYSLAEIYAAQKRYHEEFDEYASFEKLARIDKRVVLAEKYFNFSDKSEPTKDRFVIAAIGASDTLVAGEVWLVDENKNIEIEYEVCQK